MTDNQIENLLRSWNPSKESVTFKEKLWQRMQEKLQSEELNEDDLDFVAGGINSEKFAKRKKGISKD